MNAGLIIYTERLVIVKYEANRNMRNSKKHQKENKVYTD